MEDPQVRRVQATLRHVLGGDAAPVGIGRQQPTAASAWPTITAADCSEITRLLDHDNHEMRDEMKAFMNQELFVPVCGEDGRCACLWDFELHADSDKHLFVDLHSATTCRSPSSASSRLSA